MTNLLLHIINAVLLFLVLEKMTGALWGSSFVAALFALHPLHVESVAWVAERKHVLSAFFWMLTMWTYVHGNSLAEQGRIEEAIVNYTEALRINPDFAEAHFFLGLAYLMIGNRDSALEEHKILKTINPNLANTLSHKIFK